MTNRLKSLELIGYKTFAAKTFFEFSGDITAIVGPNGSGKSNIADSLRWVLGEQSFRLLRGRKTDDMIFSGSQTRPRAGMASATVTFDNSDGWLPIDFSEVSITRRAYRDGQNEYLINNQRVRLKDVNELLASSGLAERTYTVIGQGLVDAALTLKAEERRRLFEEAAGIGLYRSRKGQSLRRLENTKRNLERVEDILSELSPRLRSLRRQARRAEEYEQVRDDLQVVLREWYGYHWHIAQKELHKVKQDVEQFGKNLQALKDSQNSTEDNLSEIRERINNLRSQLNSWHRQLSQIHSRREETSRELAVSGERKRSLQEQESRIKEEITRLEEETARQKTRLEEYKRRVEEAQETANISRSELEKAKSALEERKNARKSLDDSLAANQKKINELTGKQVELAARREELESRIVRLEGELKAQDEQIRSSDEEAKGLEAKIRSAEKSRQTLQENYNQAQEKVTQLRSKLENTQQQKGEAQEKLRTTQTQISRQQAEKQVLEEAESSLAGYATGAKVLLQAARDGRLSKDARAFGGQLNVPEEYELAIAAALGDYVDAIMLHDTDESESALELLLKESARGALLPLENLSPSKAVAAPKDAGFIGVAAGLVKAPVELRPAVDLLLGQVLVVQDRKTARKVLQGKDNSIRAVTISGEVFFGGGAILVDSGNRAATLRRPRQRQSIDESLAKLEKDQTRIEKQLADFRESELQLQADLKMAGQVSDAARSELRSGEEQYRQAKLDLERSEKQHGWLEQQKTNLHDGIAKAQATIQEIADQLVQIDEARRNAEVTARDLTRELNGYTLEEQVSQVSYWEAQVSVGNKSLESARQVYQEREQALKSRQGHYQNQIKNAGEIKARLVSLDYSVEEMRTSETGIGDEIQKLNGLIKPAEEELKVLEGQQEEAFNRENEARQKTNQAERMYNQAQINLARRQEGMDTLRQRIETDFGLVEFEYTSDVPGPSPLPFDDVVQHLPVVETISDDLEEALKQQRLQLRRLGAVNPDAQKEYREVHDRHEFLTVQVEDLKQAEKDIRAVITELDDLMERDFRQTFEIVAREFKDVFSRLFAGGSAKLTLSEGEDLDSMGIDIEARLPGKRTQELALLSGGERSLTAAALVFALIKASPTPFCVMDEVDAMLDEANVGRFRQVLEELSDSTQFVVITHNRHTVQAADVIYGITMGRDTTSQSISLKLEDVDDRYSSN
ncbi:chromosome segregation protein SMC [bacterium]|nr:chromosome segregation protein SMC [bacterium]